MMTPFTSRSGTARRQVAALGLLAAAVVPHPSDEEVRRQLDDILSRPEFHPQKDFWLLILDQINAFFLWLAGLHSAAPVMYWLILVVCVVVLLLLVAQITWTVSRVFGMGARHREEEAAAERRRGLARAYWEEALRRAAAGDFTEAIRFLFLSLVYRFDEAGKVSFQKSYTNREYLTLFADRPPVYDQLKVFVDTLDDHWYGQRPTDRGQYEHCLTLYEGLN